MIPELSTYVHHSIPVMATKHYKNEVGGTLLHQQMSVREQEAATTTIASLRFLCFQDTTVS